MDAESVRRFLSLYEEYVIEVKARVPQLGDGLTTEASKSVDQKYCVYVDVLKSTIPLGLIDNTREYESLNDNEVRLYFEKEAKDSRATLTLSGLDAISERISRWT